MPVLERGVYIRERCLYWKEVSILEREVSVLEKGVCIRERYLYKRDVSVLERCN